MYLEILTPDQAVFEGEVESAKFPGSKGEFQVLNNHAALISSLAKGKIEYVSKNGIDELIIDGGVVEILNNKITVLAEGIVEDEWPGVNCPYPVWVDCFHKMANLSKIPLLDESRIRRQNRYFSKEFRKKKVEEIEQGLTSIAEISREYEVSRTSIYKWIYAYFPASDPKLNELPGPGKRTRPTLNGNH